MKSTLAAAALLALAAGCQTPAPQASSQSDIRPMWTGFGSPEARAAIRACLDRERAEGEVSKCRGVTADVPPGGVNGRPAYLGARQMSWVTIENWEGVMAETLAWLREHGPADEINDSQEKWEAAMLADIGFYMNMYQGGSMSGEMGRIGAEIRAGRTVDRVIFLEGFRAFLELNE